MNLSMIVPAVAAGVLAVSGSVASAQNLPSPHDSVASKITISCYRGWLRDTVAWDRPNSVFVEDLVQLGYSRNDATVIGEQVCRDEYGVNNADHQRSQLLQILRDEPPR